jgi:hypothetical protein
MNPVLCASCSLFTSCSGILCPSHTRVILPTTHQVQYGISHRRNDNYKANTRGRDSGWLFSPLRIFCRWLYRGFAMTTPRDRVDGQGDTDSPTLILWDGAGKSAYHTLSMLEVQERTWLRQTRSTPEPYKGGASGSSIH